MGMLRASQPAPCAVYVGAHSMLIHAHLTEYYQNCAYFAGVLNRYTRECVLAFSYQNR